jgi:hypothetical protein
LKRTPWILTLPTRSFSLSWITPRAAAVSCPLEEEEEKEDEKYEEKQLCPPRWWWWWWYEYYD